MQFILQKCCIVLKFVYLCVSNKCKIYKNMNKKQVKELIYETLVENGVLTTLITRKGIIDQVGRRRFEKAVKNGLLKQVNETQGNETQKFYRENFAKLLKTGKI